MVEGVSCTCDMWAGICLYQACVYCNVSYIHTHPCILPLHHTSLHHVDADLLGWWLAERQLPSGGLNGRPEKLPDVWCVRRYFGLQRVYRRAEQPGAKKTPQVTPFVQRHMILRSARIGCEACYLLVCATNQRATAIRGGCWRRSR